MPSTTIGNLSSAVNGLGNTVAQAHQGTQTLNDTLGALGLVASQAVHPLVALQLELMRYDNAINELRTNANQFPAGVQAQLTRLQAFRAITEAKGEWAYLLSIIRGETLIFGTAIAKFLNTLAQTNREIQTSLAQASLFDGRRLALGKDILDVSTKTGLEHAKTAAAAKSMVEYGLEVRDTWTSNLKIIAELAETMGVSADHAARLAAIVETRLGTRFTALGDEIARIVENTTVTGEEANASAVALADTMARFGRTSNASIVDMLRTVSKYEDAVKRAGGSAGEFTKMITSLSELRSFSAAQYLGVSSLGGEIVQNPANVERVVGAIVRLVETAQSQGSTGVIGAQQLADNLGLSYDMMTRLADGLRTQAATVQRATTAEAQFDAQMQEAGRSFEQLKTQLTTLLQSALLPVIKAFNIVLGAIVQVTKAIEKNAALKGLVEVSLQIFSVIVSVRILGEALTRLGPLLGSVVRLFGMMGRVLVGARVLAGVGSLFAGAGTAAAATATAGTGLFAGAASLLPPILIIAAVAAGTYAIIKWIRNRMEERDNAEKAKEGLARVQAERKSGIQFEQLRRSLHTGNTEQMLEALFGEKNAYGVRAGGLVETARTDNESFADTYLRIRNQYIEPEVKLMRATALSLADFSAKESSEHAKQAEERIERLIKAIREFAIDYTDRRAKDTARQLDEQGRVNSLQFNSRRNAVLIPPEVKWQP